MSFELGKELFAEHLLDGLVGLVIGVDALCLYGLLDGIHGIYKGLIYIACIVALVFLVLVCREMGLWFLAA